MCSKLDAIIAASGFNYFGKALVANVATQFLPPNERRVALFVSSQSGNRIIVCPGAQI